jgi:hypothetical protein
VIYYLGLHKFLGTVDEKDVETVEKIAQVFFLIAAGGGLG